MKKNEKMAVKSVRIKHMNQPVQSMIHFCKYEILKKSLINLE